MKKTFVLILVVILIISICACDADKAKADASPSIVDEPTIDANITNAIKSEISLILEGNGLEPVVSTLEYDDGSLHIDAYIDPLVMSYIYAMLLDDIYNAVNPILETEGITNYQFSVIGVVYDHGVASDTISWTTTDMKSGFLVDSVDTFAGTLTLEEVFAHYEYDPLNDPLH